MPADLHRVGIPNNRERVDTAMEKIDSGLMSFIGCIEHFAEEFLEADSFRDQVHLADHILDHLRMIEAELERVIKGQPAPEIEVVSPQRSFPQFQANGLPCDDHDEIGTTGASPAKKSLERHHPKFRNMTLAQAGESLLREHSELHGKELERLKKEGGYKSKAEHFQKMLQATFSRDGRFENVGLNRWRLKQQPIISGESAELERKEGEEAQPEISS